MPFLFDPEHEIFPGPELLEGDALRLVRFVANQIPGFLPLLVKTFDGFLGDWSGLFERVLECRSR